jgi:hypothetical protein
MSQRHIRQDKSRLSNADKAKLTIRQAFQDTSINETHTNRDEFNFHFNEADRQEQINRIADDEDGDLIVDRQPSVISTSIGSDKHSKIIEANDRRHDAVIFGDKTTEGKS